MGTKIWTAQARFDAIAPALSYALTQEGVRQRYRGFDVLAESDGQLRKAIQKAADDSGATYDDIERWMENFIAFGRPGLLTEARVDDTACAVALQGTWEMTGRWFNGRQVAASSTIYYDIDPDDVNMGWRLITMYAEENHFVKRQVEGPYLLAAYGPLKFSQVDPFEIKLEAEEEIISNLGTGEGQTVRMEAKLRSFGGNNSPMVAATGFDIKGNAVQFFGEEINYNYQVVKIDGIGNSLEFRATGLAGVAGQEDSYDNYDLYQRVSHDRPLIAGLWTIHEFWEIMKDPGTHSTEIGRVASGGRNPHILWGKQKTGSVAELRRYAKKV